jgi:hypothetical protein
VKKKKKRGWQIWRQIDTSGCDMFEVESGDDISKANEGEVSLVQTSH